MRPTSAAWNAALASSPEVIARADVLDSTGTMQLSTNLLTPADQRIVVDECRIIDDGTRAIRSTSDVTLVRGVDSAGTTWPLVPQTASALFSPLSGGTIQLWAGFRYGDGTEEVVPAGRHYWHRSNVEETAGGLVISLECQDLAGRLDACPLITPYVIAAGTNYITAMLAVIDFVLPVSKAARVVTPTALVTPALVLDEQSNLLDELLKMAAAIGYEMFMDALGQLVLRPVPTVDDDPTITYEGGQYTQLLRVSNSLDDDTTYNGVIAKGENVNTGTAPVRGEAWDLDKSSPTYYDPANPSMSNIGPRPFFYTSEYLVTASQCVTAAKARLQKVKGLSQMVEIGVVQNAALEVHDIIRITRPTAGVGGVFMVERRQLTLGPADTTIVCQQRKLIS